MTYENELQHHGILGMKWGVRRYQNKDGSLTPAGKKRYDDTPFTASNGVKVGAPKTTYQKALRKMPTGRGMEKMATAGYRMTIDKRHNDTAQNRLDSAKGEMRIKKEYAALREYNAHQKDYRKGTGDKYLNRAIEKNKYYDAQDKVTTAMSKREMAFYGEGTRNKAAQYVAKNNMTVKDAVKKAKGDALRNTAIFIAGYAAYTTADYYLRK